MEARMEVCVDIFSGDLKSMFSALSNMTTSMLHYHSVDSHCHVMHPCGKDRLKENVNFAQHQTA